MNINDFGSGLPDRIRSSANKITTPHVQFSSAQATEKGQSLDQATVLHARDPEVVQLVKQLNDSPEVRQDKLAAIQQQIESGAYFTRETAEQTAQRILG